MSISKEQQDLDYLTEQVKKNPEKLGELYYLIFQNILKSGKDNLRKTYDQILIMSPPLEADNELFRALRLLMEGGMAYLESRFQEGIDKITVSVEILKQHQQDDYLGVACMILGGCYRSTGMIDHAVKLMYQSTEYIKLDSDFEVFSAISNYHLAEIFSFIKDYSQAKDFYRRTVMTAERSDNSSGIFRGLNGLGCTYLRLGDYENAKLYLDKSLASEKLNLPQKSRALCDLGVYYLETGDYQAAEEHLLESYHLRIQNELIDASSTCLLELGKLEFARKNYQKSADYLEQALKITLDVKSKAKQMDCHYHLAQTYRMLDQFESAVQSFLKYDELNQHFQSVTLKNVYKIKNKQIEDQKAMIEQAHKDITDSIAYAERIQNAILPSSKQMSENLPPHFVMFRPKDVVAGDFYWMQKTDQKTLLAVADCTGHGVPGAMMSMICHNALNRSVKEYNLSNPADILAQTRSILLDELSRSEAKVKDGMDISLICIEHASGEIIWAGANNPLYVLRGNDIEIIKGDKQPIGHSEELRPFTNHRISLEPDDMIYLFTDGFPDQFGGPRLKKVGYKRFRELLIDIANESPDKQLEQMDNFLNSWRGNTEQIDDICVIGLKPYVALNENLKIN